MLKITIPNLRKPQNVKSGTCQLKLDVGFQKKIKTYLFHTLLSLLAISFSSRSLCSQISSLNRIGDLYSPNTKFKPPSTCLPPPSLYLISLLILSYTQSRNPNFEIEQLQHFNYHDDDGVGAETMAVMDGMKVEIGQN